MKLVKSGVTIEERLDYYTYPEPMSGCWLWAGSNNIKGYGQLGANGKLCLAHRLQWKRFNGPIPQRMFVLHKCDTPACINPNHLFLGTNRDNILDAFKKGRSVHI